VRLNSSMMLGKKEKKIRESNRKNTKCQERDDDSDRHLIT